MIPDDDPFCQWMAIPSSVLLYDDAHPLIEAYYAACREGRRLRHEHELLKKRLEKSRLAAEIATAQMRATAKALWRGGRS